MRSRIKVWASVGAFVAVVLTAVVVLSTTPVASAPGGQFCGGIAGIPCPEGFVCVDVPGDGCNPNHGGADCAGYCKRAH
ncbi:MAG TPA: hypothetical protein VJS92_12330 [Candidatus Polarisedimenticolaceae bacterium]|nr:hypothetical protein [Candidatus Polarisedimenticolaceae bacterium]